MEIDDAYAELGLSPEASEAEVKAAWRRLVARWHPDRNDSPEALRKMQRLNRALEEIRRARLDGTAEDEEAQEPPQADPPAQDDAPEHVLHHAVALTLEEAAAGCVKELRGEVLEDCADCDGEGFLVRPGACPACGGTGRTRQTAWFGWLSGWSECEACGGDGAAQQPCACCAGRGTQPPRAYRCRVRIPPGVRDGDLLQVPARAATGREALEIRIELLPHEFFELDEDGTVRCELPVDGFAWVAQRWVEVPTPGGLQQMRLRRGHHVYRLKGQGFPATRSGPRGDCLVQVVPLFPATFSSEQETLLERLMATNSGDATSAGGQRHAAWQQTLRAWEARLPPRPCGEDPA